MQHLPALDGIRAVAILIVLSSHVLSPFVPGGFGVTLFFFVSGFIITRMMLSRGLAGQRLKAFYIRRFFRLAPALVVYMLVSGILMRWLDMPIPGADFRATVFYYANYHQFTNYGQIHSPLVITWSLAVEEHFYFLFPLVLILGDRHLVGALLAVIGAILLWRLALVHGFHAPLAHTYMSTDTRLDSIAWGCLLSALIHQKRAVLDKLSSNRLLAASTVLLLSTFAIRRDDFRETFRYTIQGAALVPIFSALFWSRARLQGLRNLLESAVARFIGKISYSLYLYHFLALSVCSALIPQALQTKVATLIGAFLLATLSYYLVEGPARAFGSNLARGLDGPPRPQPGSE